MMNFGVLGSDPEITDTVISLLQGFREFNILLKSDNGFSFVEQLQSLKKIPDIAIVDLEVKIMDGLSTIHYLHLHFPNIKVLAVSKYSQSLLVIDTLSSGAYGFICKNNLHECLETAVSQINKGKTYLDLQIDIADFDDLINRIQKESLLQPHPNLNPREMVFLQLVTTSVSYDRIAAIMHVSQDTLYNYQKSLRRKLGLKSRQEFMIYALQTEIAKLARRNICMGLATSIRFP
ncbi:MAG: response regulator transcription factor [Chitinophagaceae bacterium]|nr:response regulator transcription factor [Chitinophagaceae bacterium]